jgi:hypothetical protein
MLGKQSGVLTLAADSTDLGEATWVRSGEVRWFPRLGTEPVAGDEFARRDARLANRLRDAFGSTPYGPVTRDAETARRALALATGADVRETRGELPRCTCQGGVTRGGDDAERYADFHLAYTGHDLESSTRMYTCRQTGRGWRLAYRGVKSPVAELTLVQE